MLEESSHGPVLDGYDAPHPVRAHFLQSSTLALAPVQGGGATDRYRCLRGDIWTAGYDAAGAGGDVLSLICPFFKGRKGHVARCTGSYLQCPRWFET